MEYNQEHLFSEYAILSAFEDVFGMRYTLGEKYFYVVLRLLSNAYADMDGWLLYGDAGNKEQGRLHGFDAYGFSRRICKTTRKKLKEDGLIACAYRYGIKGSRTGTAYRLMDDKLIRTPRRLHEAILGNKVGELARIDLPSGGGA